ncbi:MAG TPA: ectoine hydroxylase [Thermoanaerobaculia bacterium]|nr:ectoine hydroxylase [Thermoanaerobaculia bacterium]
MSVATESKTQRQDLYPSRVCDTPSLQDRLDPVVYGSEQDGPLRADHLRRYEQFGYLVFERMFSSDEVERLSRELEDLRSTPGMADRPETITEPDSRETRSIFAVHRLDHPLARLCTEPRVVEVARQLLGGEVYIHQSRVNYKRGFRGKEFYWHSDFETWHVEDGMPRMRAVSCSVSLTDNTPNNGPLLLIPGSHQSFVSCVGATPEKHYEKSLKRQEYGVPDDDSLTRLAERGGVEAALGPAGSVTFFECNTMHGSNSNITPFPRSNCFVVFNHTDNALVDPFCGLEPRPEHIATRPPVRPIA